MKKITTIIFIIIVLILFGGTVSFILNWDKVESRGNRTKLNEKALIYSDLKLHFKGEKNE